MKTYYRVLEVLLSEIQDNLDKKIGFCVRTQRKVCNFALSKENKMYF